MKDELKKVSEALATEINKQLTSPEVKQLLTDTKAAPDSDTGTFEVVITTENLDRYQEVISIDGWELDHYLANPVVLWMHDHTQPIGVATSLDKRDGKLVAKGKFAPNAKGQEVRQLYDAGIIKAASVGFIPKEQEGNLITKAELLEFSFVSVPANPYALTLAMERGLSVNDLVTKGIMFVEKAEDPSPTVPEAVTEPEEGRETPVEQPEAVEERDFSTKQLHPVIDSLRSAIVALEALGTTPEEPEGDEEPVAPTEDERALAEFTASRRTLQSVATVLGDVLADMRHVSEARR